MTPDTAQVGDGYAPIIVHANGSCENIQELAALSKRRGILASWGWVEPSQDGSFPQRENARRFAAVVISARKKAIREQAAVVGPQSELGRRTKSAQEDRISWSNGVWIYRATDGSVHTSDRYPLAASMAQD